METHSLIKEIVAAAKKKHPKMDLFYKFIEIFYKKSCINEDPDVTVEEWVDIAFFQFNTFKALNKKPYNFDFFESQINNAHQIHFALSMPDMPFIVDSVRNYLVKTGLRISEIINVGCLGVKRDGKGNVIDFAYDLPQSQPEALLYLRLSRNIQLDYAALSDGLEEVLDDIKFAVVDWHAMQDCVTRCIDQYQALPLSEYNNKDEVVAFLSWFKEYFTFIGSREYKISRLGKLSIIKNSELGVLKAKDHHGYQPSEHSLPKGELISISKSSRLSTIHRAVQTDFISVRVFDHKGRTTGEIRFIGLFTSDAFDSDPTKIPLLRQKVADILKRSNLTSSRFAEKKLLHILRTLPREELFQARDDELFKLVIGIFYLHEKFVYRVFYREDYHLRFISCFVFIPKFNFNTVVIRRINALISQAFDGQIISSTPYFSESELIRIHITLKYEKNSEAFQSEAILSEKVKFIAESWQDRFKQTVCNHYQNDDFERMFFKYIEAFDQGYRSLYSPIDALKDIIKTEKLSHDNIIDFYFFENEKYHNKNYHLKVYQLNEQLVTLSKIIPMIENLGFYVINEHSFRLDVYADHVVYINDILLMPKEHTDTSVTTLSDILLPFMYGLCNASIENDLLNGFAMRASMGWRDALILRVYCKYLQQLNFNLSEPYVHQCLLAQPGIVTKLVQLFYLRFNPANHGDEKAVEKIEKDILAAIDQVTLLDHDRVLRMMLGMIKATVRTNFFQPDVKEIVIKLQSALIPNVPLPAPLYDAFVYSTTFEGVHLRGGMVARGGLRWSDRRDDFRTEVLGLMKAQQVKNAIIVPAGAKGGFVLKANYTNFDEWHQLGVTAYRAYIRSLLSITDNIIKNKIVRAKGLVCYDHDDPYLVVAADKGTAKFSDIANSISQECNFWLDDAFASGGKHGYDHKALAITARGGWESVKWHFKNLEIDINKPFSVIGIGDMSGDVFGNGMLLSDQIQLVAAFNHEAIFIDPTPNVKTTFAERKRLFNLPRSRWEDYNQKLISKGGGIYPRSLKSIQLSEAAQKCLGTKRDTFTPSELIHVILQAPVDLLWNGGIGTYVKSRFETDLDVKDKQNDALRINGDQLRCRVVVEGGNLGLTQKGRIEYAEKGGLINTDFIDNSGGVDCSDMEVNSKILLNMLVKKQMMTYDERNEILLEITDEVCESVLENNRQQNMVLSFAQFQCQSSMILYVDYLKWAEANGIINRELEGFEDDATIATRSFFTRPELAVMFAKTILLLKSKLMQSDVLSLKQMHLFLEIGLAPTLVERYQKEINGHYLKKEIIATQVAKHFVFEMGVTFYHQIFRETQASFEQIFKAYIIARSITRYNEIYDMINQVEFKLTSKTFIHLFDMYRRLLRRYVRVLLSESYDLDLMLKQTDKITQEASAMFKASREIHKTNLSRHSWIYKIDQEDLKDPVVDRLLDGRFYWHVLTFLNGVKNTKVSIETYIKTFIDLRHELDFDHVIYLLDQCDSTDYIDHLTKITLKMNLETQFAHLVDAFLLQGAEIKTWHSHNKERLMNWKQIIQEAERAQKNRLNIFVVLNRNLPEFLVK